jgi:hypothetical protein
METKTDNLNLTGNLKREVLYSYRMLERATLYGNRRGA